MADKPENILPASERMLNQQLAAAQVEPKIPIRRQIRELKDPENHINPWVRKSELARLTRKPMSKGRGRPLNRAVGDYECENIDLEDELSQPRHHDADRVEDIDFGAMAQELENEEDEDEDEDPEDAPAPPQKKRKRHVDNDDLPEDLPGPSRPKKQAAYPQHRDTIAGIDFGGPAQKLVEEDFDDLESNLPSPPKKRKRGADDDNQHDDTTASPAQKKIFTGRKRMMTQYCGVQSPSLHDPPLPPKKGGFPAAGAIQYHCSRCDVALSRPDTVRKHFEKCIETNGNPDALKWTDYREVARTPEETIKQSQQEKKGKHEGSAHLPTPSSSPDQAPVTVSARTASSLLVPSQSPALLQHGQQQRQPKTHRHLTAVCGVYSQSLNDPPVQPANYGKNQSKNRYHCPRCDYALSVADSVRKHFLTCIDKNGNPDALRWTDYHIDASDHVAGDCAEGKTTLQASGVPESTKKLVPMSIAMAAKRKHREDGDVEQTYDTEHRAPVDGGRTQQKRQKRTYETANDVAKRTAHKPAGLRHSSSDRMFPTTNPHPDFARTMQPWDRPGPGMLSEIDMCTWQRREGNTIPLATELALLRGEIISVWKSRGDDPEVGTEKNKKSEERMAARKQREENDAFLAQFTVEE